MSDVLYPLGATERLDVELMDRTISDAFEDGSTSTRQLWATKNFKRRFTFTHAALSADEFRTLRGFFVARSGRYDSFWFRDNVHRGGNAKVRLAKPFKIERDGRSFYKPTLVFEEVAPVRVLPDKDELVVPSKFWWDPNREIYYSHQSVIQGELAAAGLGPKIVDSQGGLFEPTWLVNWATTHLANLGGQWQHWSLDAVDWAKTTQATGFGVDQAASIFIICAAPTSAAKRVLFAAGTTGSTGALGFALASDNYFEPWIGGSQTWTGARSLNSPADTWRSFAVSWPTFSSTASLYSNAALVGTAANARSFADYRCTLGRDTDGAQPAASGTKVAHVLLFFQELTLNDVKSLHNLFAHQYGLALV